MQAPEKSESEAVLGRTTQRRRVRATPQMGVFQQPAKMQRGLFGDSPLLFIIFLRVLLKKSWQNFNASSPGSPFDLAILT